MDPGGKPTFGSGFTFGANTGTTTTSTTPAGFSFGSASGAALPLASSGFNFGSSFGTPAATSNPISSTPAFGSPVATSGVFAQKPSSTGLQFGAAATGLLSTTQTISTGLLGTIQPSTIHTTGLSSGLQTSSPGLFGATQTSTPALQGSSLFSAKPATPQNSGLFSATQASTPATQGTSLFSAKLPSTASSQSTAPQFGSPSLFSGVAAPAQSNPSFSFGAPAKSTAPPLFGSAATVTPSSGFSFGSAQAPSAGLSFGTQEATSTAASTTTKPASGLNFASGPTATQPTLTGKGFLTPSTASSGGMKLGTGTPSIVQTTSTGIKFGTTLAATEAAAQGLPTMSGFPLGVSPTLNLAAASTQAATQASSTPGLGQRTTGFNLTGLLSGQAKSTLGTTPSIGTTQAATGFTLSGTALGSAVKTTSSTSTTTAKPVFGLGTPQTASTLPTGLQLGAGSTFGLSTTAASTGFQLASTVPSIGSTTGFKPPSTIATTSTATALVTGAAVPSTERYAYKQLEELVNKWNIELEDMEKSFLEQAAQVNFADRELMDNGEKITALHSEVERAKAEQNRLDQELDFLVSQQNELEDLLNPLEESVKQHSAEYAQEPDREREKIYKMAGKCDGQLKGMVQDLREIIDYLNASNASQQQEENPVLQIAKILNVHMDSLQWIDQNSALLQKKVDEMARLSEIRKKEHERSFRLGFD